MVRHCLKADVPFGVLLIRAGREVGEGSLSMATIGTTAEIREAARYADGRFGLVVVGGRRFRVESVTVGREPYLVGEVTELPEVIGDAGRARRLTDRVTARFVRYLTLLQPTDGEDADELDVRVEVDVIAEGDEPGDEAEDEPTTKSGAAASAGSRGQADDRAEQLDEIAREIAIPDDPSALSYLLGGIVQVDPRRRQALLEAVSAVDRLEGLLVLIDREIVLLERRLRTYQVDPRLAIARRN
jgi:Lon protease-like protein